MKVSTQMNYIERKLGNWSRHPAEFAMLSYIAFALLMPLPMMVTPFGRPPRFRNRFPQKFRLPSSGDHAGARHPTWLNQRSHLSLSAIGAG